MPSDHGAAGETVIRVDANDREIGTAAKGASHDGAGLLHRAFSVHIVDPLGRILVQRRSAGKRLWPGFWSNSCCSHPRPGEATAEAVRRRVGEELGLAIEAPEYLYKFQYHAAFGAAGSEHEICWVYLARSAQDPTPNPVEIAEWGWWSPAELSRRLADDGERLFTPWFRQEWAELRGRFAARLAALGAAPIDPES